MKSNDVNAQERLFPSAVHFVSFGVGLLYASGFLIAFNFLSGYGVYDLDFIETKYVQIGSLFIIPYLIIVLSYSWCVFPLIQVNRQRPSWLTVLWREIISILQFPLLLRHIGSIDNFRAIISTCIDKVFLTISNSQAALLIPFRFQTPDKSRAAHVTWPTITGSILMLCIFYLAFAFGSPDFGRKHHWLVFWNFAIPSLLLITGLIADCVSIEDQKAQRDVYNGQRLLGYFQIYIFYRTVRHFDSFKDMLHERGALLLVFPSLMLLSCFYGTRLLYRLKQAAGMGQRYHLILSNSFIIFVFFYLAVINFSHSIYPFIAVTRGGGDYSAEHAIYLSFKTDFQGQLDISQEVLVKNERHVLILIEETSSDVYVADLTDGQSFNKMGEPIATGPQNWRGGEIKPEVFQIPRSFITCIAHLH